MSISPTRRSLKYMRDLGYEAEVVERWNSYARIRQDFAGFGDIIAYGNGSIIILQVSNYGGMSARRDKILSIPKARLWVKAGGRIILHGWEILKKTRHRKLHEEEITYLVLIHVGKS